MNVMTHLLDNLNIKRGAGALICFTDKLSAFNEQRLANTNIKKNALKKSIPMFLKYNIVETDVNKVPIIFLLF